MSPQAKTSRQVRHSHWHRCWQLAIVSCLWLAGCSVNAVSGLPELLLESPEKEKARGLELVNQLEREFGLLQDPEPPGRIHWPR